MAGWQFINLLIGLTKIGFLGKKPLVSHRQTPSFLPRNFCLIISPPNPDFNISDKFEKSLHNSIYGRDVIQGVLMKMMSCIVEQKAAQG